MDHILNYNNFPILEQRNDGLVAYHGTSDKNIQNIQNNGLNKPFLAKTYELAEYYAEEACDDIGGNPIIIELVVPDISKLRYDGAAMDEPVLVDENTVQKELDKAEEEHPEWVKGDVIIIPSDEWEYSWRGANSIWYDGYISSDNFISEYD